MERPIVFAKQAKAVGFLFAEILRVFLHASRTKAPPEINLLDK